jgi:nanoRNase/pAp phosphatase (c-di-AMP/oligoRNAs hydrolase)
VIIYCHKSCFDGAVSAALSAWLLNIIRGATLNEVCPVDYLIKEEWTSKQIANDSCVVDFLYHPRAEYWWDHHSTTFTSSEGMQDYLRRSSNVIRYDSEAKSCASLIAESARAEHVELPAHLIDSTFWANKLDSAEYSSPQEAVMLKTPAQQISLSFRSDSSTEYHNMLVRFLVSHDLNEVVDHQEVRSRILPALIRYKNGLRLMSRRCRALENIVLYAIAQNREIVDRMMPYYWHPEKRFSLGYIRGKNVIRVTSNANPWIKNENVNLGKLFSRFGGGGHRDVGSVVFPTDKGKQAKEVFRAICAILVQTTAT